jgi:hypothetical protein
LRDKGWTWLLLAVGSALLLIVGGRLLTFEENGSGGKGSLSRKEAAQKIQAYSERVRNGVMYLHGTKSNHKRLAHIVGAILVTAHRQAAHGRAKTSFAPTPYSWQCPNVVWSDLAFAYQII